MVLAAGIQKNTIRNAKSSCESAFASKIVLFWLAETWQVLRLASVVAPVFVVESGW